MSEEEVEGGFDELDDDFEGEEIEEDGLDIDLDETDDVEEVEFDDEERPSRRSRSSSDDDLIDTSYEGAVKANPKRQKVQRKRARVIEGILDTAELSDEDGRAKAWASLQKQAGGAKPRPYAITAEYTENDVLEHPKFGEGYVVEILTATKISVLFEDGLRRLAHNRS